MRKWCPEPFDEARKTVSVEPGPSSSFEAGLSTDVSVAIEDEGDGGFRKDHCLSHQTSLWNIMSQGEKDEIHAQVRQTVQVEFEVIQREMEENHRNDLARVQREFSTHLENFSRELQAEAAVEKSKTATQAAGLAVALANRIIRDTVQADPGFIVRTLETALFKIQDSHELTAILHPEDAALLSDDPALMKQLRLSHVVPDRRIEKGGCRLRSGIHEWDATLSRQMETLVAIVEESLAVGQTTTASAKGDDHVDLLD